MLLSYRDGQHNVLPAQGFFEANFRMKLLLSSPVYKYAMIEEVAATCWPSIWNVDLPVEDRIVGVRASSSTSAQGWIKYWVRQLTSNEVHLLPTVCPVKIFSCGNYNESSTMLLYITEMYSVIYNWNIF